MRPSLTLAVLAVAAGGWAGAMAAAPAPTAAQLAAHAWSLRAIVDAQGQSLDWQVPGRAAPQWQFQDGRLAVQGLCNVLGAGYTLDGARLQVAPVMATKRACAPAALMTLEQRIGTRLPQVQRLELRAAGASATPMLVLHFADGERWELAAEPQR